MDADERRSEARSNRVPMSQQNVNASLVAGLGCCSAESVSIYVHLWFPSASIRMGSAVCAQSARAVDGVKENLDSVAGAENAATLCA